MTTTTRRTNALTTAIVVGLLCLFALGRIAYASQQCYRLTGGGCGGGVERIVDGAHHEVQLTKICAQQMEAPDDRGSAATPSQAAFAMAPLLVAAFVPAPQFRPPLAVDTGPAPAHVAPLKSFGRLRL